MDRSDLFVREGGTLSLWEPGLRDLLREVLARGVPFRFTALGISMAPFICSGDVLTVAPLGGRPPRLGEVAAFVHPAHGRLMVHRLVGRRGPVWLARGDNALSPDGLIPPEHVLGRVTRVERQGRPTGWGLGSERVLIAWLSRHGRLIPLLARYARVRRRAEGWLQR